VTAITVNAAVVAVARTVTNGGTGTVSSRLLLNKATAMPPAGAAPLIVTVQVAVPKDGRLVGRHDREVGTRGAGPPPVTTPPVLESVILAPAAEAA